MILKAIKENEPYPLDDAISLSAEGKDLLS